MLKQFSALILLVAFATQTFNRTVIVIDYYSNKAYFASKCENKNVPVMHCNGKCQMMKMLKQEEKKDQENSERKLENKFELFTIVAQLPVFHPSFESVQRRHPSFNEDAISSFIFPQLRPPQV